MFLKELVTQGWQSLMRNRLRSVLTMLGIVWGLASVVILLAYGQGLGGSVLHAFMNMGNNVIVLWPGQTSLQAGGQRAGKKVEYEYADVEAIRDEVPLVRAVSAEVDRDFGYKVGTRHGRARRRSAPATPPPPVRPPLPAGRPDRRNGGTGPVS
jgi:putative ABC transport system permease protein